MPNNVTTFVYGEEPPGPAFQFSHNREKRLFVLSWSDGRIEKFRDNPARQLVVEPDADSDSDPETGELRPVIKRGRPVYVYLCREGTGTPVNISRGNENEAMDRKARAAVDRAVLSTSIAKANNN